MKTKRFHVIQPARSGRWGSTGRELLSSLVEILSFPRPFEDPESEREFLEDHGRRFAGFRRAAGILGLFVWTGYIWVEFSSASRYPAFRHVFSEEMLLRCIGIVVIGIAVALSFRRSFVVEFTARRVLFSAVSASAALLLGQIFIAPSPLQFPYLSGLSLVLFFQFGFLQLRAKSTFLLAAGVVITLMILQAMLRFLDEQNFVFGVIFLFNLTVIGLGVNVQSERHVRERFSAEKALALSNTHLKEANAKLSAKHRALEIAQREQLSKTNALITLKEQQKAAADEANREKSNFLAGATHDLRQPMHALNLYLEAAEEALRKDDVVQSRRLVAQVRKSSTVMGNLFNAVLDLSKLDSGRVCPAYHVFDLTPLVRDAIEQLRPLAAAAGVSLRLRCPPNVSIWVRSDPHWLGRIVANLISNGVKYSDQEKAPRCTVLIGVVRSVNRVRIDVVDNGVGIAPQYWNAIFKPFFQIDNAERDRDRGLGLGLSIVNAMVSMLDEHRVELKSSEGRGSRFSVEIPICHSQILPSRQGSSEESATALGETAGLYVLLVEDDGLVRAATEALLAQWGVLVDSASSVTHVEELLESIERYPDLIITDYQLHDGKTAHDVTESVYRKLGRLVPCLVITGEASSTGGIVDYDQYTLIKPVTPELLRKRILEAIVA
ncbi:Sensor histidine kinase RcsC [Paraburkholderia ultramafica]|uniref:histidine kinase n=1 Tax=Paraburkholderia ultramafica TaxID=1544867 RepID=A0A6S7CAG4_9BURK|nr:Sensor histidine kinase RcsC [Paraburkholderia ultramafica]